MSETIDAVKERLAQLDPNNRDHLAEILRLKTQETELTKQQEQQEREQQFVEHIDGLLAQIQEADPFGKMFPRDAWQDKFGLTEYGDMQKQLNGFIYGVLSDQQTELFNKHKEELAQKDSVIAGTKEQNRAGEEREAQLKRQNESLQESARQHENVLQATEKRADAAENNAVELLIHLDERRKQVADLEAEVESLKAQLAEANKPKETAPSQSLTERLQSLQPVKSLKDLSPDEMIRRFEERQASGGKVALTAPEFPILKTVTQEVAQTGNTFPAQVEPENDQLLPAQEVAKESVTFPTSEQPDGLPVDRNGAVSEDDGQVTRAEFEELKKAVDTLYVKQRALEDHLVA